MSNGIQRPRIPPTAGAARVQRPQLPSQRRALLGRNGGMRPVSAVGRGMPGLRPPAQTFTGPHTPTPLVYDAQGIAHPANGRSFLRIPEAGTTGQGGNTAAGLPQGTQSNAAGPISATNPAATTAAPGVTDSTFAGQAGSLFKTIADQRAGLEQQGRYDAADFAQANAMRARQAALASENADYAMNRTGNFYSGQLGKAQGQVRTNAMEQQTAAQSAFNRAQAARQAQLDAIGTLVEDPNSPTGYAGTGGAASTLWGYYGDAVQRRIDANPGVDPGTDAPAAPAAQTPAQRAIAGPRRLPDGRVITARAPNSGAPSVAYDRARGGYVKTYPDGRTVFVKKKKKK